MSMMPNDDYQDGPDFPVIPRQGSREFSESHYKFLSSLIESVSARSFFQQVIETDFSHQCILEFHKVLTSGFDKNAILARNAYVDMRILDFDIALNLMIFACHESDIQNPAFLTFQENIRQTFKDFVSRSQDAEERRRLLKQEYDVNYPQPQHQPQMGGGQPMMNNQPPQQNQPQKRGFFK